MHMPQTRLALPTSVVVALVVIAVLGLATSEAARAAADDRSSADAVRAAAAPGTSDSDARPVAAVAAVLGAFDKHRVVALGEAHGLQQLHDFIRSLVQTPAFADKANDIIVEWGNARYQEVLDRYIAGEDVPIAEVGHVWRDTAQSPAAPWDAAVYEEFFSAVRAINQKLPAKKRLRVLAADPPVDWGNVQNAADLMQLMMGQRAEHCASIVTREVLGKGRKGLLIGGMGYVLKTQPRILPFKPVAVLLEEIDPGSTFVILPHIGFGNGNPALAGSNAELERRMAAWPAPSVVIVGDTWLAALEAKLFLPPAVIRFNGREQDPYGGLTLADAADAYLYLGPRDSLTRSNPRPETFDDKAYVDELNRRSLIRFGKPFDREGSLRAGKKFYDPNTRPATPK